MAQQTALSVMATPGMVHSFLAKTEAAIATIEIMAFNLFVEQQRTFNLYIEQERAFNLES